MNCRGDPLEGTISRYYPFLLSPDLCGNQSIRPQSHPRATLSLQWDRFTHVLGYVMLIVIRLYLDWNVEQQLKSCSFTLPLNTMLDSLSCSCTTFLLSVHAMNLAWNTAHLTWDNNQLTNFLLIFFLARNRKLTKAIGIRIYIWEWCDGSYQKTRWPRFVLICWNIF
jgi:hypothetical protein